MPGINKISRSIRNTRRFAETIEVLVRHGFAGLFAETGLRRFVEHVRDATGRERPIETELKHLSIKVRLRLVLEELGPTYIKLGQVLSTRPDLIPPDVAEEFKNLQSDCPKTPFVEIRQRLEKEFPGRVDEMFTSVDEDSIASASIAQTHRAVLATGQRAVLKIVHPGIERKIDADMAVMGELARLTEARFEDLGFRPTEVMREFKRQLERELDLVHERRCLERLRLQFEDTPQITFPLTYGEYCSRKVLAMQEAPGVLLGRKRPSDFPPWLRRKIVQNGADAVYRMCLRDGFFHADPHPGNIFVQDDGRICFIDCGMTGQIEDRTRIQLLELVAAVVHLDLDKVLSTVLNLVDAELELAGNRRFRMEVWEIITRFQTGSMEGLDITGLLESIFDLLRDYRISMPADLVYLIKALTTIQGVGQELDPAFDIVARVRPLVEEQLHEVYGPGAMARRAKRALFDYADLAESLPREFRALSYDLRRRRLTFRLQHEGMQDLRHTLGRTGQLVAGGLLLGAVVIGSSLVWSSAMPGGFWPYGIAWLGTTGLASILAILLLRDRRD